MPLTPEGYEITGDHCKSLPTRLRLPSTSVDAIRDMIRHEVSRIAEANGEESFDEASDLDPPSGEPPLSPYEDEERHQEHVRVSRQTLEELERNNAALRQAAADLRAQSLKAKTKGAARKPAPPAHEPPTGDED